MHLTQVAFLSLFLITLSFAFARGGRPERLGAGLLLAAALATPLLQTQMFTGVEYGVAAVDLVLLGALFWLVLACDRRWTVLAAGFQALGVLTHVARFKAGPVHGDVYGHLLVLWSYPVMLSLLWGTLTEAGKDAPAPLAGPLMAGVAAGAPPMPPVPDNRLPIARGDDLQLLTQLLQMHDVGHQSSTIASDLLSRTGSFAAAVSTPATRLGLWGFEHRVAAALVFARETTRATLKRKLENRLKVDSRQDTIDYLHSEMAHLQHEQVRVLYLNNRNRLIADDVHGSGTINQAPVYIREIIKRAIEVGAVNLIIAHNHPSGDPSPSQDDIVMTRSIIEAGRHVGVSVIDHLVIGTTGHFSMRATGLI